MVNYSYVEFELGVDIERFVVSLVFVEHAVVDVDDVVAGDVAIEFVDVVVAAAVVVDDNKQNNQH